MPTVEDRLEITDLVHRYAEAVDDGRPDRVAALFDDPCEFRAFAGEKGVARTSDEVEVLAGRLLSTFERTSHHVSNVRVVVDSPERARGLAYLHAWHRFPGDRPDGVLLARYHDAFVRTGGRWLFAERVLRVTTEIDFPFRWLPPEPSGLD